MSRIDFVTGAPEQYAHLVDALATIPDRLRTAVGSHRATDLRRAPNEGGWSAQEILAHLAFYSHANGVFIHRMVTMADPQRTPFPPGHQDSDLLAKDPEELLAFITDEIGQTVAFLSETPDAAWGRRGLIRGASQSVRQVIASHTGHFEEHIVEITRILHMEIPAAAS